MKRKTLLYLYTFLGVGFVVFIVGFTGINISLRYIENKYVNLQLDVNKRQAQSTARLLESELANGMTEENHCYENAIAERVNGILKDEFYLDQCFFSTRIASIAAKNAIEIYNSKRLHISLGYKTPNMVFESAA